MRQGRSIQTPLNPAGVRNHYGFSGTAAETGGHESENPAGTPLRSPLEPRWNPASPLQTPLTKPRWDTPPLRGVPGSGVGQVRKGSGEEEVWNGSERDPDPKRGPAIVHGDNLPAMRRLVDKLGPAVTLAYLDPPFCTGRAHVTRDGVEAFDDRWGSVADYVSQLRPRLEAVRALLASWGSCVVHVDWRVSAHVRLIGDEVFGAGGFASEIIWRYRRWPSRTANFQRVHDVLLRWVRDATATPRWNQLYEPLAASTVRHWGTGRQLAEVDAGGRRRRSATTSEPSPGVPLGDVWELPIIAPRARERTGYPTQKPEALLERLILATTGPGDLVLDPYMGSGTTVAVAARLNRRAIGIDSSAEAIRIALERLALTREVTPTARGGAGD